MFLTKIYQTEKIAEMTGPPPLLQVESVSPSSPRLKLCSIEDFRAAGVNVAEWARARGFAVQLVYSVLRGDRKCFRGQSYKIAKELGMK